MTSNLRQIKLFFVIVALVSVVCLVYAYNWNMNFYKITGGEIAQVKYTRFRQTNTATRSISNSLPERHSISDKSMVIQFNNTVLNVEKRAVTSHERTKDSQNNINDHLNASVDSINPIRTDETLTKGAGDETLESGDEVKTTAKHTDNIHTMDSTNENEIHKVTAIKANELDSNDNTKEKTNGTLNTTAGDNKAISNAIQNNTNAQSSDSKESAAPNNVEMENDKVHVDAINSIKPTEDLNKDSKGSVTNETLNAESVSNLRDDLQKVKDRWKSKKKKTNHATVDNQPVTDDRPKTTRDTKAFERVKAHLKQLGYSGNKLNPFALSPHLQGPLSGTGIGISDNDDATSRPDICKSCFKSNFAKLINEPKLCEGDVDLLILITSTPINTDNRAAIRKTWGKICLDKQANTKCVFVFGNKNNYYENKILKDESNKYHDITQFDFYDVYANLTYKTLSAIQWSHDFCPQAKYVMKTDDDMYVNSDLLPLLLKGAPDSNFIGGMCWGPSSPHRDMNSKWYVSFVQYKHSLFPSMCSGTGYVMSRDVADGILRQSPNVPFFYLEDVYVAICVNKLNVKPLLLAGFKNVMVDFDACVFRNRYITVHGFSGAALETCWKQVHMCALDDLTPSMVYSGMVV